MTLKCLLFFWFGGLEEGLLFVCLFVCCSCWAFVCFLDALLLYPFIFFTEVNKNYRWIQHYSGYDLWYLNSRFTCDWTFNENIPWAFIWLDATRKEIKGAQRNPAALPWQSSQLPEHCVRLESQVTYRRPLSYSDLEPIFSRNHRSLGNKSTQSSSLLQRRAKYLLHSWFIAMWSINLQFAGLSQ